MANQPAEWRKAVTYRLPGDLVAAYKAAAEARGETEKAFVTRALERELAAATPPRARTNDLPR